MIFRKLLNQIIKIISKITFRLLLFNILLVFLPIAFLFYLDTYEKSQLIAQERAMVQQGRLLASALTNSSNIEEDAEQIIDNLNSRLEARIRIISLDRKIIADSSSSSILKNEQNTKYQSNYTSTDSNLIYSLIRYALDLIRYILRGPKKDINTEYYYGKSIINGVEVKTAFEGKYGATTRISKGGQRSITLYSALPILNNNSVIGVVLVSQSTYRILQNLYQIRLDILKIFLISLTAAIVISFIMSRTIAYPLKKLRNEAKNITDKTGKIKTNFKKTKRLDEIGDLNRSLEDLTLRLKEHMEKTQSFASDISHEFKNPLASIKSAAEILSEYNGDNQFISIINQEVKRLERLITEVREISLLDSGIINDDELKFINPYSIIEMVIARLKLAQDTKDINFIINNDESRYIEISPTRFSQIMDNILSNAISFSPPNGVIFISIKQINDGIEIKVIDEGPGIPEENLDKVFNRFFTYRKDKNKNSGLGLSITQSIVKSYGGSITISNTKEKGAQVSLKLRAGL